MDRECKNLSQEVIKEICEKTNSKDFTSVRHREENRIDIKECFKDVIGYDDIKNELYGYCDVLRHRGYYKKMGVYSPHGLLLHGEPGIGKTMIANCFINACKRKAFTIRKDKADGSFIKHIQKVFKEAKESAPSIVLLDDMDKYANEDYEHRNAEEYVAIQACIDEVKHDEVFVIATVNDFNILPESLKRTGRFDRIIEMERPTNNDATRIIQHQLENKKELSGIDVEEIAGILSGCTCAVLESVINEAGIYAGYAYKNNIEKEDIIRAYLSLVFQAAESLSEEDEEFNYEVAVHEAGHAIVAETLRPGSVRLVSICRHTGSKQGITSIRKAEDYRTSYKEIENQVLLSLGGRAANEVVNGFIDFGSRKDLEDVQHMLERVQMDQAPHDFITLTQYHYRDAEIQRETRARIIAYEMDRYYKHAKEIIVENRKVLDLLVAALLEQKTLTHKDIAKLFGDANVT